MAWAPIALAATAATGSIVRSKSEADAANFNASVAEQNAAATRSQGVAAVQSRQRDIYRQLGAIRSAYGASGVTMEGTAMDVFASSAIEAELDVANTQYNYDMRARSFDSEARLGRARASAALAGGVFSAAGGAASAYTGAGGKFK